MNNISNPKCINSVKRFRVKGKKLFVNLTNGIIIEYNKGNLKTVFRPKRVKFSSRERKRERERDRKENPFFPTICL